MSNKYRTHRGLQLDLKPVTTCFKRGYNINLKKNGLCGVHIFLPSR